MDWTFSKYFSVSLLKLVSVRPVLMFTEAILALAVQSLCFR